MKMTTPFKAADEFEKELKEFSKKHRITLAEHSKRISDYFEMSCYSLVIRYYIKKGYMLEVKNLIGGKFKFKCSPLGFIENFSYFKASKIGPDKNVESVYIFHNATAQSADDKDVFTTPDVVVSKSDKPSISTSYYMSSKMKMTYISNDNLVSFCEVKNYKPFPELMVSFTGTVNELKPICLCNDWDGDVLDHIAPSLMMSGTFGKQTKKIKDSLEGRYFINFFDNLFENESVKQFFSKAQINKLATLGKKSEKDETSILAKSLPIGLKKILDEI